IFTTWVALNCAALPRPLLLPFMLLAGIAGGALWALIPALLKVRLGTNETLVTLMLNYVALKLITYLQYGPWKAPGGFPKIPNFGENALLPDLFGQQSGWVLALLAVGFVYLLMRRSKIGYEIAVIGESPSTARYAGIPVVTVTLITLLISGGLCGMAGMIQVAAVEKTLVESFTGGLGFTAAITAWLAKLNPGVIVLTSFAFSMMISGSSFLETAMRIPSSMADVIQGMIILFVLGCEFFTQYKLVRVKPSDSGKEAK
ncbi:MAG: ABC transporter permease, partial [Clostridia bacterium]|nr:ABC transporter permease [Clostridia bacterium]